MKETNTKIEVRDLRNGNWYWIHRAVIKEYTPKVGATSIAVYNFLASCVDTHQSCFPSQKYIAERIGYSRATVNKAIQILEEHKLIKIEKRSRYHCVYHLLKVSSYASKTQKSSKGNSDVNQS